MNHHGCRFCNIIEGSEDLFATNPFVQKGLRTPYESDDLVVFPDAAPLSYGHCLIVPRRHILSIATLNKEEQKEILNLAEGISDYLSMFAKAHIKPYYFEHGSTSDDQMVGCSTVHAHFHILFAPSNLLSGDDLDGFQKFSKIEDGWNALSGNAYYLLGELGKTTLGYVVKEHPLLKCTMFVRKVFSSKLNRPELADYKRYSKPLSESDEMVDCIYETYDHLREFSKCKQQILQLTLSH